jgi:hypothetical protein
MKQADLEHVLAEYVHANHNYVAVVSYGNDGLIPMDAKDCGMVREEAEAYDSVSCVGSSGDNACGFYMGLVGRNVALCACTK